MEKYDYEIFFTGAGDKVKKDADAICGRFTTESNPITFAYDFGVNDNGATMGDFAKERFFANNPQNACLDFAIISHPHEDHIGGVSSFLEKCNVETLYANIPWNYLAELKPLLKNSSVSDSALERKLREEFSTLGDLEKTARAKGIPLRPAFTGDKIAEKLLVLSPTKEFFLQKIAEHINGLDNDTKNRSSTNAEIATTWEQEDLSDNVSTSPLNETSIIVYGKMGEQRNFLLTGDAGVESLTMALDYSATQNINLCCNVGFFQVPHHGSRHNATPELLDRLLGKKVSEGTDTGRYAFASTAKGSDHPKKVTTNAWIKRGVKVFATRGKHIRHSAGNTFPCPNGWVAATPESFSHTVEAPEE